MKSVNKKPDYYRLSIETTLDELKSTKTGLSDHEAKKRLEQNGPNKLEQLHKESIIIKYFRQYKDLMIILLLASSLISFYLGDARTAIVLFVLVLFNTTLGFFQEFNAERIMESLERLMVASTKVKRADKLEEISSTELVIGDIVYVEEGDNVPADLRIIEESELSSNDFALTGESNPSRKFAHAISSKVALGNRHNLLFMGTTIATGHGFGVVTGTGMHTELGRIASLSQATKATPSPLQQEMDHTATRVTQGTMILCLILMFIAIKANLNVKDAFLFAVGIASSLIPQGLPAEINTALAQAANKLAKAQALVKKLSAVESLGATSVICTDKTGTLTKNEMTVQQLLVGETVYKVSGSGYEANGKILDADGKNLDEKSIKALETFFSAGFFASNAHINPPDDEHNVWYCLGDPTEGALITLARKAGLEPLDLDKNHPELKEFAFDSARKLMSSIRKWNNDELYIFVKGAPESVLNKSTKMWEHGKNQPFTTSAKDFVLKTNETLATKAMRNLAYAYKKLPADTDINKLTMEDVESDLTWIGMVSMIDPPREEVPDAILRAQQAHIKIAIVTGDYATTAKAIAEKAGLGQGSEILVIQGENLPSMSDQEILTSVQHDNVIFSRVSPEDKLRIVKLIKESGLVVAVTGDGINDAPALKVADIGVAMGKTGTDVAKQSAKIILLDDSFHTLVSAVEQGRIIFQNIKKGTLSCFTSNSAELIVNLTSLGFFSLMHVPLALTVMEILAIDLVAELFPITALGMDPADRELMKDQPRNPRDHIINKRSILDLLWCGILIGGFAFMNYMLFYSRSGVDASSVITGSLIHMQATALTYLTIVLCQLGNIMQRRSSKGLFTSYQFHNKQLWFALVISMFCVLNIIYNPWIAPYFGAAWLSLTDWLYAIAAVFLFISIREIQRIIKNKLPQHQLKTT